MSNGRREPSGKPSRLDKGLPFRLGKEALGRKASLWDDRMLQLLTPQGLWRLPPVFRYGMALAIIAAAVVLRQVLTPWLGMTFPHDMTIVAVAASTVLLGLGPGLLTVFLGSVAIEFFVMRSIPSGLDRGALLRFAVSASTGAALAYLLHGLRAAELRSKRNEARLAAFGAATFEGVVESEGGRIVDCNEQFARMAGRPMSEMTGLAVADLIAPEDMERVRSNILGNVESVVEHGLLRKDGTRLIVEAHGRPAGPGSPRRHTVIRDITESKKAEESLLRANAELAGYAAEIEAASQALLESRRAALNIMEDAIQARDALRESEERLKRAQEIAHLGSWELDIPGNTLTWSEEVYRIFGLTPGTFGATYEAFLKAVHADDRAAVDAAYSNSLRDGRDGYEIEHRVVRSDSGEVRVVIEKCQHVRDASGKIVRSVGMVHDITERKKAEGLLQALAEQERLRLGAALEQASDAVIMIDLDGTIRYVNAAFESINKEPREEAKGRSYLDYIAADPSAPAIRRTITEGHPWHGLITRRVASDRPVELEVAISTVTDPEGAVIGGLVTEKDVTQENVLQRQLRQGQKMEALGTLAGGITHDFNNILAAIIMNTELALLDLDLSHPARAVLPTVLQAANRGKELVKQIITFSRQKEWDRKPIDIAPVIREAVKFLRSTLPKDVGIRETIATGCGAVLGDASQLNQVLVNLCQNGALAMREEGGSLKVRLEPLDVDEASVGLHPALRIGPYVRLTVEDSGCGMTPEVMERIFEPFFTTRAPGRGSGLGLAVVHGIVRSYGGAITVSSEPGRGSVFSVYIPRLQGGTPALETTEPRRPSGGREHILLVEDESAQRASLARTLERLGYSVTARATGRSALAAFKKNPADFDVVITDQTMPKMTGIELAAAIVKARPGTPVILCTGFSEKIDGAKTARGLVREFLMKPFTLEEITRVIRKALAAK